MKSWTTIVAITVAMLDCAGSVFAQDGGTSDAKAELATEIPKDVLEPFFKTYCIRCHGPEKQNNGVRFDRANWVIANSDVAQRWQDVLDVLNGGDMPPEDEKQPESAELAKALETLTETLQTARDRLTSQGGEIILRRLNRREYANTIRDLFGVEINPLDVPPDNDSESFDTVGSDQLFTSSTFDRYLELGERIATEAFRVGGTPRQESEISRKDYGAGQAKKMRSKLEELDRQMAMKKAGATWQEMGFKDAGEAKIIFSQWEGRAEKPRRYLQLPLVDEGLYLADFGGFHAHGMAKMSRGSADPRGTYRVRLRGGIHGKQPEIRQFVVLSTPDRGLVDTFRLQGAPEAPQIIETELRPRLGEKTLAVWFYENRMGRSIDAYIKELNSKGPRYAIWVDWLEMEGPFYDAERSFFETLTFEESSGKGRPKLTLKDETAQEWIERFAFEAFRRRKPAAAYVDGLVTIFKTRRQEGQSLEEAMSAVVSIILSSPGYLYLQEHVAPEPTALAAGIDGLRTDGGPRLAPTAHNSGAIGRQTLDDRELAERLACFLWSSPPDAALYARVEDGTLSQDTVLRAEVDRMLADPKAEALYEGFVTQWGDLKRFEAVTVDERYSSRFNKGVRQSATRELPAFFKTLVEENLPAANLIDSDFVVIDPALAQHYGIDGVTKNGFQKVALNKSSPRGGLLGQAAFLVSGSNGERSSPVIRGALVMQKLLHDKPAPPPPNVPELGAEAGVNRSNRELVEFHQRKPQCASCHKKMDVIGFGLENFDTIGQWRDTERVGKKDVPIQTGGQLPDGGEFANLDDLKRLLRDHDDQLAEELVESLLAYGLGRNIEFTDTDAVEDILTRLEPGQFRLRDMISEIAVSPIFRSK